MLILVLTFTFFWFEEGQKTKQAILDIELYISEHSLETTDPSKLNRLAWHYGRGLETQNIPRAIELYKAAIQQGHLESQFDLGFLLVIHGDEEEGMSLIQAASNAGYTHATSWLKRQDQLPQNQINRILKLTSDCRSAVASRAPIPDKVSFSITSFDYDANNLRGDVDFMNQYGAWMPHRFTCNGNDQGEISRTSVNQGYW